MEPATADRPPGDPWHGEPLDRGADLAGIRERIAALADNGNLAAVIVHFNDTYLIEERPPRIPGLARIAGAIDDIRTLVRERLGADRTLVCHGGDYLGPSRLSREFKGAQMVELLRHCGLNVATLGNHEFDHDPGPGWDTLRARLIESRRTQGPGVPFKTVLSNLRPPAATDRDLFDALVLWPPPPAAPLFAVCGHAGEQTVKVASAHGFVQVSTERMLAAVHERLFAAPSVLAIVVLTHASRDEDRALQRLLRNTFPEHAIYVLGGHDHHMQWAERVERAVLLKCLSNGRSLGVIAVPKDGLAAVRIDYPRVPRGEDLTFEDELRILEDAVGGQEDRHLCGHLLAYPEFVLRTTMARLRPNLDEALAGRVEDDFIGAFEKRMGRTLHDSLDLLQGSYASDLCFDLVSLALGAARRHLHDVAATLDCSAGAPALPVQAAAQEAATRWLALSRAAAGGDDTVVNFESCTRALNALDGALRARSTDFGNFVADAMRRATGAALALVNAGALRADDTLPPRLTRAHLRDVLLYDDAQAGAVLQLSAEEVRRMLAHARRKGDHGAFLQVSAGCEVALEGAGAGSLRVALVRHMIAARHDEDGYCATLAAEGEPWEQAQARLLGRVEATASLEAWICAGAAQVAYANDQRLSADLRCSQAEADAREFIGLVDRYREVCWCAGLRPADLVSIDAEPGHPQPVRGALDALLDFAERGHARGPGARDAWFTEVYKRLMSDESNYTGVLRAGERPPIRYHAYLDLVVEMLGLRRHRIAVFRWLG